MLIFFSFGVSLILLLRVRSSLHPFGTLVEEIGPIGQVEVETSALLKDCKYVQVES